ncbi:hypothetical protein [Streptomyces sp. NPDC019224]|uniref:hypothetical protein n=1 Tax=Streptomyces sp. NPDC019224 TaxID=3154484 RepID=UPI0034032039
MHRDVVEALAEGELQPLREWLAGNQVDTEILHELPQWNSTRFPELLPSSRRLADRTDWATAEILAQLPKVAPVPGGVPLLLLFVLLSVEAEWEISYHYQPMWDTLRGARDCLRRHGGMVSGPDALLVRAVLALMGSLASQIDAENAMTTGQSEAHEAALEAAVAQAREAAALAERAAGEFPEISGCLIDRAEEYQAYNAAVVVAVRAVRDCFATGEPLDTAIEILEEAETGSDITNPVYMSELRAHRFALMGLNRARHEPWLRIDQGKLVYLYPFATRGVSLQTVLDTIGEEAEGWLLGGVAPLSLNGSLKLDDVWDGADAFKRHYDGSLVVLPRVLMHGADGEELGRFQAEIRFSKLGNHSVRFASDITDASPAELYAMMLRAAPEHGAVRVSFEGSPHRVWPRLADLAVQLAEDTCRRLRENEATAQAGVVARQGMFQLVVTVDAASTTPGPANGATRHEVSSASELLGAVGAQLLTNPVTYLIGSLAEWIRYGTDNELCSTATGLIGEQTVRTSNTTVIMALGTAAFTQGTRSSVVEFAASLDGLFAGWSLELADHYRRVDGFQARVDAAEHRQGVSAQALTALSRELDVEKIRLNDFATEVRSTIALIRSPSLLSSPVVADSLRLVLEHCGFEQRVAEINTMIDAVVDEQLGVTIEKLAKQREEQEAREEERRENRQRAKLEVFLAAIAAAGISGVIQVLQAGYFQSDEAATWAVVGVVVIFCVALLLGILVWPRSGRRR